MSGKEREEEGYNSIAIGGSMSSEVDATEELSAELLEGSFADLGAEVGGTSSVMIDAGSTQNSTGPGANGGVALGVRRRTAFDGFEPDTANPVPVADKGSEGVGVGTPGPSTSLTNTPVGSQVLLAQDSTADALQDFDQPVPPGNTHAPAEAAILDDFSD